MLLGFRWILVGGATSEVGTAKVEPAFRLPSQLRELEFLYLALPWHWSQLPPFLSVLSSNGPDELAREFRQPKPRFKRTSRPSRIVQHLLKNKR